MPYKIFCKLKVEDLRCGCDVEKNEDTTDQWHQALLNSIREVGVIEPILVINIKEGYHVKVGNSRVWAARVLGIEEIKCIVVTMERDFAKVAIPEGEVVEDVQNYFTAPVHWVTRENYVAMKNTHIHMGDTEVK